MKTEDSNKTGKAPSGGGSMHPVVMRRNVEEYDLWLCCSCKESGPMEHKDMIEHMKSVHKITDKEGTCSMLMYIDGADFYVWKYEWDIEGHKFIQETRRKRKGRFGA